MRVVLTGANRGLGLEFARQLIDGGHEVAASARDVDAAADLKRLAAEQPLLSVHACDVAADDSVAAFRAAVEARWDRVDLLLNNAGVTGIRGDLAATDFADALATYNINALGPLRTTREFLPMLRRSQAPKVVHVTSKMGSIDDNSSGGYYAYRMSKIALNMACRNLMHELSPAITACVLHPGWVRTDMGGARCVARRARVRGGDARGDGRAHPGAERGLSELRRRDDPLVGEIESTRGLASSLSPRVRVSYAVNVRGRAGTVLGTRVTGYFM